MLIGTNRWVLVLEGQLPPGVDEMAVRMDLTSISLPIRLLGLVENTRLIVGTQEQVDQLLAGFPK